MVSVICEALHQVMQEQKAPFYSILLYVASVDEDAKDVLSARILLGTDFRAGIIELLGFLTDLDALSLAA